MATSASRAGRLAAFVESCVRSPSLSAVRAVHAQLLNSGLAAIDTFLANRLVELYTKCSRYGNAVAAFRLIRSPNVYSWNAAVSAACKSRDIAGALQLFDEMPDKNVVSWNTVIAALAKSGWERDALGLFNLMLACGFAPTSFTFASVLSACSSLAALEEGRQCHALVAKVGLHEHLFVENAVLGMYVKCDYLEDAVLIFDCLRCPNEVSFTTMMSGLAQSGDTDGALRIFRKMCQVGIKIDHVAISSVLGACTKDESHGYVAMLVGQSVHALASKAGFNADVHVKNSILDMYAKCGSMEDALRFFNWLEDVTVVTWNILIAGCSLYGDLVNAKEIMNRMQQAGFEPDEVTQISMLAACSKAGDVETARMMFDNIASPNVTSWNALLSGYCQGELHLEAINLFRKMQFAGVHPDRTTMTLALSCCSGVGALELGKQIHSASAKSSVHKDVFVASGLVDMYAKCGRIATAEQIFDMMPERDVVSWNSMLTGLALHWQYHRAFSFYQLMRDHGVLPTESSYASVVSSCARLPSVSQGRQVHAQVVKDGYAGNVYVGSALINMYLKCGSMGEAKLLFDCLPTRNIVSWNEIIHGYAQNGLGEEAVHLFEKMLSTGVCPDSISFIAVLTACSHSGLVDRAIKYLNDMEIVYGIRPQADHYTCVIDTLGRASRLGEADELIENMPCKDDPVLWEVLLSACSVHRNAGLGECAAEHLFRLDPMNPSGYVLLANMYAALGRHHDALAVRKLMIERGIEKSRAYSWPGEEDPLQTLAA